MAIDIIITGCAGGRGSWLVSQAARHSDFRIVALVDTITSAAHEVFREYLTESVPVFADTAEALAAVECDAIMVATPDVAHIGPVLAGLNAGKYVFVEKPLSLSIADCLAIDAADRQAGGRTMVGFNLRLAPVYRKVKALLDAGKVGRLLTIQADEFYYGGRTYFRRWNRLRSIGGGLWITKACHDFDLLAWLAGALPKQVNAVARLSHYVPKAEAAGQCRNCALIESCPDAVRPSDLRGDGLWHRLVALREEAGWYPDICLYNSDKDTFDNGIATIAFENDVLATYTVNVVSAFTDRRIRIAGTDGIIEGSLSGTALTYWKRHRDFSVDAGESVSLVDDSAEGASGHGGADAHIFDTFASFVRGECAAPVAPAEASIAVAMGLAATQASDTETAVQMADFPRWQNLARLLVP